MNIAIIHQDKTIIDLFSTLIKELNFSVSWTSNNFDNVLSLHNEKPVDLILIQLELDTSQCPLLIKDIMSSSPTTIIVISNSILEHSARIFETMSAGALDVFAEPLAGHQGSQDHLKQKIRNIDKLHNSSDIELKPSVVSLKKGVPLIAIGASTGGPAALLTVLQNLPDKLNAVVVIIQHMDNQFSQGMASWLNEQCPLSVSIATEDLRPQPGQVYMAGTNDHLTLTHNGRFKYITEPIDYPYRPSVNVFFESALTHWNNRIIGVLLTGMGRDGADGLLSLYKRGMPTIAQDRESCAVYGMPKAAMELGAAQYSLPLDEVARKIIDCL